MADLKTNVLSAREDFRHEQDDFDYRPGENGPCKESAQAQARHRSEQDALSEHEHAHAQTQGEAKSKRKFFVQFFSQNEAADSHSDQRGGRWEEEGQPFFHCFSTPFLVNGIAKV